VFSQTFAPELSSDREGSQTCPEWARLRYAYTEQRRIKKLEASSPPAFVRQLRTYEIYCTVIKVTASPKPKHYKKKSPLKYIINYKGCGEFCKRFFQNFSFFYVFSADSCLFGCLLGPLAGPLAFSSVFSPFER